MIPFHSKSSKGNKMHVYHSNHTAAQGQVCIREFRGPWFWHLLHFLELSPSWVGQGGEVPAHQRLEPCRVWIRAICIRCQNLDCLFRQKSKKRAGANVLLAGAKPREVSSVFQCQELFWQPLTIESFYTVPIQNMSSSPGLSWSGTSYTPRLPGRRKTGKSFLTGPLLLISIAQFLHPFLTQEVRVRLMGRCSRGVTGALGRGQRDPCVELCQEGLDQPRREEESADHQVVQDDTSVPLALPREKQRASKAKGINLSAMPVNPRQPMEGMSCLISAHHPRTNTWPHQKGCSLELFPCISMGTGQQFCFPLFNISLMIISEIFCLLETWPKEIRKRKCHQWIIFPISWCQEKQFLL